MVLVHDPVPNFPPPFLDEIGCFGVVGFLRIFLVLTLCQDVLVAPGLGNGQRTHALATSTAGGILYQPKCLTLHAIANVYLVDSTKDTIT